MAVRFTDLEKSIITTLAYYDVFDYPLTDRELYLLISPRDTALPEVVSCLHSDRLRHYIHHLDGFYFLNGKPDIVQRRKAEEENAIQLWAIATRAVRFMRFMPFVRCICVSGDLSKGVGGPHSDIDFFIITAHHRVYVCKLFLAIVRRFKYLNQGRLLCINYLVSEGHLGLETRDTFTAEEVAYLAPLYNRKLHRLFLRANRWVGELIPRFEQVHSDGRYLTEGKEWIRKVLEFPLRTPLGMLFDRFLKNVWRGFWSFKYRRAPAIRDMLLAGLQRDYNKVHGAETPTSIMQEHEERLRAYGLGQQ